MRATEQAEEFLQKLQELPFSGKKLILGRQLLDSNYISAYAEIIFMPTTGGGFQYAISGINFRNQKEGGRYTSDPLEIAIWAIDFEKRNVGECSWFYVPYDSGHTVESVYGDAVAMGG